MSEKGPEFSELITCFSVTSLLLWPYFFTKKVQKLCEVNEDEVLTHTYKVFKVHKLKNKNFELSP